MSILGWQSKRLHASSLSARGPVGEGSASPRSMACCSRIIGTRRGGGGVARRKATGVHTATTPDGVRIEFEIVGEAGPTIVLLHGSFTGRRAFSRQRDALVAAGYRLVLPSMRGHDGSVREVPPGLGFDSKPIRNTGFPIEKSTPNTD